MRYVFTKNKNNLNDFDKRILDDIVLRNYFTSSDIDDFINFLKKDKNKIDMLFLSESSYNSKNYSVYNPIVEIIKLCFTFSFSSNESSIMKKQHELLELCMSKITNDLFKDINSGKCIINNEEIHITSKNNRDKMISRAIAASLHDALTRNIRIDKNLIKDSFINNFKILTNKKFILSKIDIDILLKSNVFLCLDKNDNTKNYAELIDVISSSKEKYNENLLKLYALTFNNMFDGINNPKCILYKESLNINKLREYIENQSFFSLEKVVYPVGENSFLLPYLYENNRYEEGDALFEKSKKTDELKEQKILKSIALVDQILFNSTYAEHKKLLTKFKNYILNEMDISLFKKVFNCSLDEKIIQIFKDNPNIDKKVKYKDEMIKIYDENIIIREKSLIKENLAPIDEKSILRKRI